jgi:hypothetical protein
LLGDYKELCIQYTCCLFVDLDLLAGLGLTLFFASGFFAFCLFSCCYYYLLSISVCLSWVFKSFLGSTVFSCCFLVTLFSLICVRFCFSSSPSDLFFRLNSGRSLDYLEPCYLSMQSSCKFTMLGKFFGFFYTNIIHVLLENDFWIFILISSMYCIVAFHTNAIHVQYVFEFIHVFLAFFY